MTTPFFPAGLAAQYLDFVADGGQRIPGASRPVFPCFHGRDTGRCPIAGRPTEDPIADLQVIVNAADPDRRFGLPSQVVM